jgi:uroporphyrinogen III methyltransferase/synthase
MRRPGKVTLVGAGPGRPDLLTLRGAACLAAADVVVVDALVDRRVLEHGRPGVRVIDAGKRGHGRAILRQPAINRLLVRLAKSGKTVCRLKGGDPYFFGRGGEEAECLARSGVPFEVVPGVSSVTAVPAYAGVPVTHRDFTSVLTVVTGHLSPENTYLLESPGERRRRRAPGVDWERIPKDGTLVVLMGVLHLADIARRLRAAGWDPRTPALVTRWGTWTFQRSVEGTLGDIAARVAAAGLRAPAVVTIGRVVSLRKRLNWFERLPLFGRTVVVTRARDQASDLARELEELGARVLAAPVIEIVPLPASPHGSLSLRRLGEAEYDGVLFTSANAVEVFARHWKRWGAAWPSRTAVYAVGPKTAEALRRAGLPVHHTAEEFRAESLVRALGRVAGKRFLFPRAREGRDVLPVALRDGGATVHLWPLYRTAPVRLDAAVRRALLAGEADAVTFASSSAADSFLSRFTSAQRKRLFSRAAAVSIGPVTSDALRRWGVRPTATAARSTVEDLAAAVARALPRRKRR